MADILKGKGKCNIFNGFMQSLWGFKFT